jgi:hypothetical protein
MPAPNCTMCEINQGVLMDTNLQDGETQVICGPCLPAYAICMAAALTQDMTTEGAEVYGPALDIIYANDPRAPKTDRLRPGRKARRGHKAGCDHDDHTASDGCGCPCHQSPPDAPPSSAGTTGTGLYPPVTPSIDAPLPDIA